MKPASTDYPPVLTTALLLVGVFSTVITLYACIKGGIGIIVYDYAYHTGISGCCLLLAPGIAFLKGEASRKVVLIPLSVIISLHVVAFLYTVSPLVHWTPTEAINTALPLAIGFYVSVALLLASLHVVYKQASSLDAGGIDEHDCAPTEDASPEAQSQEARLSSSRLSRRVSLWGGVQVSIASIAASIVALTTLLGLMSAVNNNFSPAWAYDWRPQYSAGPSYASLTVLIPLIVPGIAFARKRTSTILAAGALVAGCAVFVILSPGNWLFPVSQVGNATCLIILCAASATSLAFCARANSSARRPDIAEGKMAKMGEGDEDALE